MTNTPEKIKQWEDAAKEFSNRELIDSFHEGFEEINKLHSIRLKKAYLQGRQDEWKEGQKEIDFRMKLLKQHFFNVQRLAMPDENLTDEILEPCWNVYCIEKQISTLP